MGLGFRGLGLILKNMNDLSSLEYQNAQGVRYSGLCRIFNIQGSVLLRG